MELRPRWKIRWLVIAILTLPTLGWFGYSLFHPGVSGSKKNGDKLYRLVKVPVHAQQASPWMMQESGTKAGLRGIHSVDGKVAWASGTGGTVLKTTDGGEHWQKCAVPGPDGETLDFRGVQAWFDDAVVMSSGPGGQSRLYRTTDSCKSWSLEAKNAEQRGFWDALLYTSWHYFGDPVLPDYAVVIGDPLQGRLDMRHASISQSVGKKPIGIWQSDARACEAKEGEALFAASNSSVALLDTWRFIIGTGGKSGAFVLIPQESSSHKTAPPCLRVSVPVAGGNESSGIFSLAFRDEKRGMAVGGDYTKPNESSSTAAWTSDGGKHWTAATNPPHGYRSSVAWSEELKAWIAAGTNGSDISRDDGKTWHPLDDGNWNALSLPFVVGPNGRIARLSASANLPK